MIRINEGKPIKLYLERMFTKYSEDEQDAYNNLLYFEHLLLSSYEEALEKIKNREQN